MSLRCFLVNSFFSATFEGAEVEATLATAGSFSTIFF